MTHQQNNIPDHESFSDLFNTMSQGGYALTDEINFNENLDTMLPSNRFTNGDGMTQGRVVCIQENKPECVEVHRNQNIIFGNSQQNQFYHHQEHQQPFVSCPTNQLGGQNVFVTTTYRNNNNGCLMNTVAGQNYDQYNNHALSPNSGDRASISNSPYTPTVRQDFPITPPGNIIQQQPHKSGSIPSLSDYPGDNGFEIYFGKSTESAVKNAQFTHSTLLEKLFVKMNALCPVQFRCRTRPPEGCIIRALPVYTRPEHVTEVVSRCPNHQLQDNSADHLARHLIRAEQPGIDSVRYVPTSDGRESVTVAYCNPEVGTQYSTVFFKYMCLSSCVGGINRRPITTVFTLETRDGVVIGRRCIEVRICSCPGRDRSQEERRKRKANAPPGYVLLPKKKKSSSTPSTSTAEPTGQADEFILRVRGKEKYKILKKIKEALDLKELISPQQEEEYRQKEASEESLAMREVLKNYFKQSPYDKNDGDGSNPFPT
uniref:cellular tumor antigen p53-like n=1 Tax=Styela clava TaxID=7725 RepID=UPI00193A2138|nr:cellular tumor antigen p53-like [Styela clava]